MKFYHVETQEDYDALMIEFEENGCEWMKGEKPTQLDEFKDYGKDAYVYEEHDEISISSAEYFKKYHSDETLIEYKAKGENMEIYHTETQEAYDELMSELEEKGYKWLSGRKLTGFNYWEQNKESSCVIILSKYITFMNIEQSKKKYPNIPIIDYKAKGENMTQEEMKQELKEILHDMSVAVCWGLIDTSTVEADLLEAKSSAKKLIEKIDEYLENSKPKFEVGDYVTVDVNGRKKIAKIDALRENKEEAHGLWYDKTKVNVKQDYWFLAEGSKFRHATPEEIAEYESALSFHKHGRKPFDIKDGDMFKVPSGKKQIIIYPEVLTKPDFLNGWELIKTAEEVEEWLGE